MIEDMNDSFNLVEQMATVGYRFIISRSHHRPKGLPIWRASFCKWGGKSNRWFGTSPIECIEEAAKIAQYNESHPNDRFVQVVSIKGREAEV